MTSNVGQIKNCQVLVEPSQKLRGYLQAINVVQDDTPIGIQNIVYKNKPKGTALSTHAKPDYLTTEQDKKFIKSLNLSDKTEMFSYIPEKFNEPQPAALLLTLQDLHWLYTYIHAQNVICNTNVYLHELMEGSEVILPKNEEIPRSEELERRCQKLKAQQENKEYQNMTKNVDGFRRKLPEDTIAYQLRMMNSHLIAVFQFIVSVITGFVFGFIGIELLVGNLDFGFRLMLGIGFALIIALAELYFLAKKLNEDLEFESSAKKQRGGTEKKVN